MKHYVLFASMLLACTPLLSAAADVEKMEIMGDSYTVSKTLPAEILGTYHYEGKGEPIVQINADGTGLFQPHQRPAIPIKIWIDVQDDGTPRRQVGTEQRYRYTLLIQYGAGGDGNYPAGKYDLMGVTMLKDEGKAIILGERIRQLN
jgi:hypothetical protein